MNVKLFIQKRQNNIKSILNKKIINKNDFLDKFSFLNTLTYLKSKKLNFKSKSNDKNERKTNYTDLYEKIYFGGLEYLNYKENELKTDNNILKKCFIQKNILLNSKYLTPGSTRKKSLIKPFNLSYTKSFFKNKNDILLEKNIIKKKIDLSNIKIMNNSKKKSDFSISQLSQKNNSNNNTFRNSYIKNNFF
jgi:hypothetical protein